MTTPNAIQTAITNRRTAIWNAELLCSLRPHTDDKAFLGFLTAAYVTLGGGW